MRPDFAIQRMCSGVVPQQPPTIVAPSWTCGARTRRSTPGWPCRGGGRRRCAAGRRSAAPQSGRPAPRRRSAMASASCGPSPQLTPMTSAPQSRSVVATCAGVDPSATVSLRVEGHRGDDRRARAPPAAPPRSRSGSPPGGGTSRARRASTPPSTSAAPARRTSRHLVELGPGRHAGDEAGRPDRAGHPRVLARRRPRQPGAGQVVRADLVAQPMPVEAKGWRRRCSSRPPARRRRCSPRGSSDHVRPGHVELLEVLRDEDARARRAGSPSRRRRRGASAWPPGRACPGAWGSSELCYIHRVSGSTLRPSRRAREDSEHDQDIRQPVRGPRRSRQRGAGRDTGERALAVRRATWPRCSPRPKPSPS